MMAAGRAAERGLKVLLLEKNYILGEKVRISGGGRCNIANAEENERVLLSNYGKSEQFLYSLFSQFGMKDTFEFFESKGLKLKIEAKNRAFPVSDNANDVVTVLEKYMAKHGVDVRTDTEVKTVIQDGKMIRGIRTQSTVFEAHDYLYATGGVSRPETGSTGDGFGWLRSLGHTVASPTPTIVPLSVSDKWITLLAGITLPAVRLTFFMDGVKQFRVDGDVLCAHFGVTGPTILNSAHKVADIIKYGEVTATIDLFPKLDAGQLERQIIELFDTNKNKDFKTVLRAIVPTGTHKGIVEFFAGMMDIDQKVHSFSKDNRKLLVQSLKAMPIKVNGLMGFSRAVVADGGVALSEVDMRTMRSKLVANLLVTGDLLHISRPSGGFSLQLCWSTGWVAGSNAGPKL